MAFAVVSLAFCGAAWWLTHPATFVSSGWGTGVPAGFGPVATDVGDVPDTSTGQGYKPVTVTFMDVSAVLAPEDRALVDVSYVLCRPTLATNRIMTAREASLPTLCAELRPFAPGATVEVPTWQVLAVLTPRDGRPLVVDGFLVTYRDGIRAGQQHLGPEVELNAPEAGVFPEPTP